MMRKVEAQIKTQPKQPVVIRDVMGNEINLGVQPRLLFAGEESGGMIIGPEELIRSEGGRMAIAMREKSAGEALVIQAAMTAALDSEGRFMSDNLLQLFEKNNIQSRYDLRHDTTYYNQSNPDPDALKVEKALGEAKRTKNYEFYLSTALAVRDGELSTAQAASILSDVFAPQGLSFDDMLAMQFVGDGVYMEFPNKVLEIRPSGTDAKSKAYAMGDDKTKLARYAAAIGGYSGELTALHRSLVPARYVENGEDLAWKAYDAYYRDGLPPNTYEPPRKTPE